ncbi:MAG: aminodeoxychorismate lyase [Acinetobacter sp.]
MQCYKNGVLQSSISLQDRAFHYGDGCFTTAVVQRDGILLWHWHLKRLELARQRLALNFDISIIEKTMEQLISSHHAQGLSLNGTIKIVISRGEGPRGYAFPMHPADVWLFFYPSLSAHAFATSYIDSGVLDVRLGICMPQLRGLKTLNRLEQVLIKQEALYKDWSEALVADINGNIVEGISSNCFIYMDKRWITPNLEYNGVQGVMREEILYRMHQAGIQCEIGRISLAQCLQIEALFFCNALNPMQVATTLQNRNLDHQRASQLFQDLYLDRID